MHSVALADADSAARPAAEWKCQEQKCHHPAPGQGRARPRGPSWPLCRGGVPLRHCPPKLTMWCCNNDPSLVQYSKSTAHRLVLAPGWMNLHPPRKGSSSWCFFPRSLSGQDSRPSFLVIHLPPLPTASLLLLSVVPWSLVGSSCNTRPTPAPAHHQPG